MTYGGLKGVSCAEVLRLALTVTFNARVDVVLHLTFVGWGSLTSTTESNFLTTRDQTRPACWHTGRVRTQNPVKMLRSRARH
jgi:hypothetical protein